MMDKTISQALQMASQPNVDPMSADITSAVKALNSPQAWQAYLDGVQAIKGGAYNPAMTSATSQYNIGQTMDYAGKATQLDTALKNLTNASKTAINSLKTGFLV